MESDHTYQRGKKWRMVIDFDDADEEEMIAESMSYFDRIDHSDLKRAILLMEKYKEYYKDTSIADIQIALYYDLLGDRQKSKEIVDRLYHSCPKNKLVRLNCEIAIAYFKKQKKRVVQLVESSLVEERLYDEWRWIHPYYCECLLSCREYEKIIRLFEQEPVSHEEFEFLYWAGYCYEKLKNYQKAIECYGEFLKVDAVNPHAIRGIFRCLWKTEGVLNAIRFFQRTVRRIAKEEKLMVESGK